MNIFGVDLADKGDMRMLVVGSVATQYAGVYNRVDLLFLMCSGDW
jgi:hypothetical protein